MPGLRQIQNMLERELGTGMPYHNYFWRGKTRDELVATQVFGLTLVVPGRAEESNLLRAMKGLLANDGSANPVGLSLLRALFRQARFSERDVALLEAWISESCPEVPYKVKPTTAAVRAPVPAASDDTHVQYWRAIDDFFLPGLASEGTVPMSTGCTSLRCSGGCLQCWAVSRRYGPTTLGSRTLRKVSNTFGITNAG